ncbi:MAG: aldo/keto reductase [Bryobacteraceae bacterium]
MARSSRRDFLKTTVAAGMLTGVAGIGAAPPTKKAATDLVTLGDSGVKVTRLAFGTGTFSGRVQRDLGQADFTTLVRHAYDRGVRFFETADSYHGMPQMLAMALKGVPRDSYRLMTKYNTAEMENPQATIRRLCSDLGTDHVDIMLLHCVRSPHWPEELKPLEDVMRPSSHALAA